MNETTDDTSKAGFIINNNNRYFKLSFDHCIDMNIQNGFHTCDRLHEAIANNNMTFMTIRHLMSIMFLEL
ncbi:hypothetical protein DERP_007669 [Dermatophagoides pteronyssinus]|uniref:Uncharacterized protein n=1 Tax=Dermatophagoides pteronyssinus TaxID=6956 RepID=A0ABQ8JKZ5_DERPT|nr:hypothetical protein DERP_007669 [Dermatophagoides pteronyssinus]